MEKFILNQIPQKGMNCLSAELCDRVRYLTLAGLTQ
jgi:hypothetical protein